MRTLDLYVDTTPAVEKVQPEAVCVDCAKCPLGKTATSSPAQFHGKPGGVLILRDRAQRSTDLSALAQTVARYTGLPVAVDFAIKCAGKGTSAAAVDACRPHLAQTLSDVKPKVILIAGKQASQALLGHTVEDLYTSRHCGGYLTDGTKYFFIEPPQMVMADSFRARAFKNFLESVTTLEPRTETSVYSTSAIVVDCQEALDDFAAAASAAQWACVDCETYSQIGNHDFEVLSIAVCFDAADRVWVWNKEGVKQRHQPLVDALRRLPLAGQNIKFDLQALHLLLGDDSLQLRSVYHDTQIIERLLNTEHVTNLEALLYRYGMAAHKEIAAAVVDKACAEYTKIAAKARKLLKKRNESGLLITADIPESVLKTLKIVDAKATKAYAYALIPEEDLLRYNALDTLCTAIIVKRQEEQLEKFKQMRFIWDDVLRSAIPAFAQIELWGAPVDTATIQRSIENMARQSNDMATELRRMVGDPEFNPNSTQQVAKYIYDVLGLSCPKQTKSGARSTDDEVISSLDHPFAKLLSAYRKNEKLLGTYGTGLLATVRDDGRTHSTFFLDGARTGRLSCKGPNLQNQNKNSKIFWVAPDGYVFVVMDYSQQELRIAADLSGDTAMIELFKSGTDFHMGAARIISMDAWKVPPDKVNADHRREAKRFVFGLLYGTQDATLASDLGIEVSAAAKIRAAIYGSFRHLASMMRDATAFTLANGCSWTRWKGKNARLRNLTIVSATRQDLRGQASTAKNSAFNSPIQGTANEYCTASASKIVEMIWEKNSTAQVVATIHDAIVSVVAIEDLNWYVKAAREIMLSWPMENGTPLATDLQIGKCFGRLNEAEVSPDGVVDYVLEDE